MVGGSKRLAPLGIDAGRTLKSSSGGIMDVSDEVVLHLAAGLQDGIARLGDIDLQCRLMRRALPSLLALARSLAPLWRSADPDAFDALRLAASALATVCDSDGPALLVAHVPLREPDPVHRSWRQQVLRTLGPSWRHELGVLERELRDCLTSLQEFGAALSPTAELSDLWDLYMAIIDDHLLLVQGLLCQPAVSAFT